MERPKIGHCQRIDEAPSVLIVNTARLHELIEYSVWAEQQLSKLHQPAVIKNEVAVCDKCLGRGSIIIYDTCLDCEKCKGSGTQTVL